MHRAVTSHLYTKGAWRQTGSLHYVPTIACYVKMVICAVYGCYSGSTKESRQGVKFFRFPKDKHTLKKWILACKRKDEVKVKCARVCSKHFRDSDYKQAYRIKKDKLGSSPTKCRLLHPRAVPSVQLPNSKREAGM